MLVGEGGIPELPPALQPSGPSRAYVSYQWLEQCLAKGQLLSPSDYPPPDPAAVLTPTAAAGKDMLLYCFQCIEPARDAAALDWQGAQASWSRLLKLRSCQLSMFGQPSLAAPLMPWCCCICTHAWANK